MLGFLQQKGPCCLSGFACMPMPSRQRTTSFREEREKKVAANQGTQSEEILEDILVKMEAALDRLNGARGKVGKQTAKIELLWLIEGLRDILLASLTDTPSDRDRSQLAALFGGKRARIERIRAVLGDVSFSTQARRPQFAQKLTSMDRRTSMCLKACKSVEDVLEDAGHAKAMRIAIKRSRWMDDIRGAVNKALAELEAGEHAFAKADVAFRSFVLRPLRQLFPSCFESE